MAKRSLTQIDAPPLPATNKNLHTEFKPAVLREAVKTALMNGAYEVVVPYLNATTNARSLTGSVIGDRIIGAKELQEWATTHGVDIIGAAKLTEIDRCINAALRKITDENGRPIDRKSRVMAALASQLSSSDDLAKSGE